MEMPNGPSTLTSFVSADVVIGMRLLDIAERHGFVFPLLAPDSDGPLWGVRDTEDWHDTLYIGRFSTGCSATRSRKSSLIVPGDLLVDERVSGGAP